MKFLIIFGLVLAGFIFVSFFDEDLAFSYQLFRNSLKDVMSRGAKALTDRLEGLKEPKFLN